MRYGFFHFKEANKHFFAIPIVSKCALLENSFDSPKNSNSEFEKKSHMGFRKKVSI